MVHRTSGPNRAPVRALFPPGHHAMDAQRHKSPESPVQPKHQSGATAIEFAFVLPLLIALTYALFVYSYVYVVYESINFAAQQGAEAAVAVDPGVDDVAGLITVRAQTTIASVLDWLPESQRAASIGPNGSAVLVTFCSPSGGGGQYCPAVETGATPVVVRINFPLLAPNLFPVLELPLIGTVPPLPAAIVGVGVVLIPGQI